MTDEETIIQLSILIAEMHKEMTNLKSSKDYYYDRAALLAKENEDLHKKNAELLSKLGLEPQL